MTLAFTVLSLPAPQGSKKHVGKGIMVESSKKVKPWREAVVWAAREAMGGMDAPAITGPVHVSITFTLPKPKSAPKTRQTYPDRKPDIDKLLRSTLDALSTAGVYEDDARVISVQMRKVYPGEGEGAMDVPGASIWVVGGRAVKKNDGGVGLFL